MQTRIRRIVPFPISARTRWRLGSQRRLVCAFEWLTLNPVLGPLPHNWHLKATIRSSKRQSRMESLAEDPTLSNDIQVVVVGNSRSTITVFEGDDPRLAGVTPTTGRAAGLARCGDGAASTVVVSVVPAAWPAIEKAFARLVPFLYAQAPIAIHYRPPEALGLDRLANALAGRARYGAPVLVVDCGTATTFTLVDARGELAGGAITAGLGLSSPWRIERRNCPWHPWKFPRPPLEPTRSAHFRWDWPGARRP